MTRRRVLVLLGLLLVQGCATSGVGGRGAGGPPVIHALLLNGGGTPRSNFYSHVMHLSAMYQSLVGRGVDPRYIHVLSADGESTVPDLAVVRVADGQDAWLLEGTTLDRSLRRPVRYVSAHSKQHSYRPATRSALDEWFAEATEQLRPGDTLLFFVTDHGERGTTPERTRITLWDRQSITVAELRSLLGKLNPGVRVVQVMSQCYSGAFAESALSPASGKPVGSTCGFYAATAERMAYGCYPDANAEDDGYAIRFASALARRSSVVASHEEVLVSDRTPDVPLRSSELALERFVRRVAEGRRMSLEELVSAEASAALTRPDAGRQPALVEEVAGSFSIPVPREPGSLAELDGRLQTLGKRLDETANIWEAAVGELAQANLDEFLASTPSWGERVLPRQLSRVPFSRLRPVQQEFVTGLVGFTRDRGDRYSQLTQGRARLTAARTARTRSQVRQAALLRLRVLLTAAVGDHLLATEGTVKEQSDIAALRSCEDLSLPAAAPTSPPEAPPAFPPIESDERLIRAVSPAFLGVSLVDVPAAERTSQRLPAGAMTVLAVEPGSPAEAARIAPGDVLLGEAKAPAFDKGSLKLALASGQQLDRELELVRQGRRLRVTTTFTRGGPVALGKELPAAGRTSLAALTPLRGPLQDAVAPRQPHLLFFWATWCTFCKLAVPELMELERQRGIRIVAITDENQPTIDGFLRSWRSPFPEVVALDLQGKATEAFEVDGYPTFILVDDRGRVTHRWSGYRPDGGLPVPGWKPSKSR